MRALVRWVALVLVAGLALQFFFLARIALMATIDPQSTTFQRSEAWRIATQKDRLRWRQQWVPYGQISDHLKRAVIASEDGSFTSHEGVDWEALEKAWERNVKAEEQAARRAGRAQLAPRAAKPPRIVGGSTITQQLAKNILLSGERTLLRKGQEFVLAFALEKMLSKERILEIYLNSVEWGEGRVRRGGRSPPLLPQGGRATLRLRGRAPGRDAAAAQVLRTGAELRLPRQSRLDDRGADARRRAALSSRLIPDSGSCRRACPRSGCWQLSSPHSQHPPPIGRPCLPS